MGILEDVPLQEGKFFIPYGFMVMEMEEDAQIPIILERPVLSMVRAMIDVENHNSYFKLEKKNLKSHSSHVLWRRKT